jgi:Helix-turn-helix domain
VNDKKSEVAGTPEARSEPSGATPADRGSNSEAMASQESLEAPADSTHSNGGTAKATTAKAPEDRDADQSLGAFLIARRERRGFTAEDVVRETRLPAHYLRMMESNDYSKISDKLYLLPFLRRYATYLDLDQEDVAMRFVREVQRTDNIPPTRLDQPLLSRPRRHRGWTGAIMVIGFLAAAAALYLFEADRHRKVGFTSFVPHATSSTVTGSGNATYVNVPPANVPPPPASH